MGPLCRLFSCDKPKPSVVSGAGCGCASTEAHEMLCCSSASEKRLDLRQRKRGHPTPWEPGEEQQAFSAARVEAEGTEITST